MGKVERGIFTGVLILLLAASGALGLTWLFSADAAPIYRVSILLDGSEEDYWENFMLGVDQAAQERNVDVRTVSRYDGTDVGQAQAETLGQELENGFDGVILAPVDEAALAQVLAEQPAECAKVAVAGPRLESDKIGCYISADPLEMGRKLADAVAEGGWNACAIYLDQSAGEAAALRLQGMAERLAELGIPCETVAASWSEELPAFPASDTALAAVEPGTTALLCRDAPEGAAIYGVGASNDLLRHLEEGRLCALVVQCDYEAGYLSLQSLLGLIEGAGQKDHVLDSYVVTAETMFEDPMNQILFPIS